jgi:hypothetical protein
VKHEYLKWIFVPYETVTKKIKISKHRLAVYRHTSYMNKQIGDTGFAALFIHSADAFIVYKYLELTRDIERGLNRNKLGIKVGVFTNHDNFGISHQFSPYLKIILKEAYNQFADSDYIENINVDSTKPIIDLIKEYKTIYCVNENFVKH